MHPRSPIRVTLSLRTLLLILAAQTVALAALFVPRTGAGQPLPTLSPSPSNTASASPSPTRTPAPTATRSPSPTATGLPNAGLPSPLAGGTVILAMADGANLHLFAYNPLTLPPTRLTDGAWDDTAPAVHPASGRVAFVSRRNGYWDLFLLDPAGGQPTRLTDTATYDGAPSWSPEGTRLVYETYEHGSLDLAVLDLAAPGKSGRLTSDPGAETSPAWSPDGHTVAYIADRDGSPAVWLLDAADPQAAPRRLPGQPDGNAGRPAWSPDGRYLAFALTERGAATVWVWDSASPTQPARPVGAGDWPVWTAEGALLSRLRDLNHDYLTAYDPASGSLLLAPQTLPGAWHGAAWQASAQLAELPRGGGEPRSLFAPTAALPGGPGARYAQAPLAGVAAPYPFLHDRVDEAFAGLREQIARETGWDALASLENAAVPLTAPLAPAMQDDWHYTGRAFNLSPLTLESGWLAAVREDYGTQTTWRVFLKTRYQDGSQGQPLSVLPWDFAARRSGDPVAYEQGGQPAAALPAGYWVDLTELARRWGWERLPAQPNWTTYFPGARFATFAITEGLSWRAALEELYPPEALVTPTPDLPPTQTPTRAPTWYQTPAPSRTPVPSQTPTRRPTWTPPPQP